MSIQDTDEKILVTINLKEAQNIQFWFNDYLQHNVLELVEEKWFESGIHIVEFDKLEYSEINRILLKGKEISKELLINSK